MNCLKLSSLNRAYQLLDLLISLNAMIGNFPRAPHKFPTYDPRQSLLVRVCLGLPKKTEQNQTKKQKQKNTMNT